jgi:Flp pilus assembly pilin Flp
MSGSRRHRRGQSISLQGQGLVEYAIIIVLVALVAILGLLLLSDTATQWLMQTACAVGGIGCGANDDTIAIDFGKDEALQGWMVGEFIGRDREFWVEDGRLHSDPGAFMLYRNYAGRDYTAIAVEPRLETFRPDVNQGFSVAFRAEDINGRLNGYTFRIYHNVNSGQQAIYFSKVVEGRTMWPALNWSRLPDTFDWQQPGDVKIEVVGNTFTAYINGQQVMQASDDTFESGQAGLVNMGNSDFSFKGFIIDPH